MEKLGLKMQKKTILQNPSHIPFFPSTTMDEANSLRNLAPREAWKQIDKKFYPLGFRFRQFHAHQKETEVPYAMP